MPKTIKSLDPRTHGAISVFYLMLYDVALVNSETYKKAWAGELNVEITDGIWEECLRNVQKCLANTRHNLIQYKVLHRLHYSQEKLQHFTWMSHQHVTDVNPR